MQILLFRHAEKQFSHSEDPPLSARGMNQALKLAELVLQKDLPLPTKIFASPKQRAVQTLQPLAQKTGIQLQIMNELDEKTSSEHAEVFSKRVKRWVDQFEKPQQPPLGVVYVVSHLDWLMESMIHIHSDTNLNTPIFQNWAPAQGLEFEVIDKLWTHLKHRSIP